VVLHGHGRTLPLLLYFFFHSKTANHVNPYATCCRFSGEKKTCLRRFVWHGLCSMASICPCAWPPLTLVVARRRCLRPGGMTTYLRASSSSCCLSGTNSSKSFVSYFLFGQRRVWVRGASQACKSLAFVCAPWFLQPNTWFGFVVDCWSPLPSAVVCSLFISGPLLSFIMTLTLFTHLAMFCQHPESSLASIVAMCCCQSFSLPPLLPVWAT